MENLENVQHRMGFIILFKTERRNFMIESILFLMLSLGLMGIDQAKENERKRKLQEERRKRNSNSRFFWKR